MNNANVDLELRARNKALYTLVILRCYQCATSQMSFPFWGLFCEDMSGIRFTAFYFSRLRCTETLCRTSIRFHFWHNSSPTETEMTSSLLSAPVLPLSALRFFVSLC
jgi:hypothetical protein